MSMSKKLLLKLIEANKENKEFLRYVLDKLSENLGITENAHWKCDWKLIKWDTDINNPYEVVDVARNIVLDVGVEELWKIVGGLAGATPFSNGNAVIGVGRNNTAEAATQTGLLDASAVYKAIESNFPTVSGRTITYQATFGNDEANFTWNEMTVQNGTGANAKALNRRVQNLGTKVAGNWTLRVTFSLA